MRVASRETAGEEENVEVKRQESLATLSASWLLGYLLTESTGTQEISCNALLRRSQYVQANSRSPSRVLAQGWT